MKYHEATASLPKKNEVEASFWKQDEAEALASKLRLREAETKAGFVPMSVFETFLCLVLDILYISAKNAFTVDILVDSLLINIYIIV